MIRMKNVAQVLRETREEKNLTIEQVSNSIKIRPSLIEALEKGEYFVFSSDIHLKSFLRAYANYLGIHTDKIMALYRRETEIKTDEDKGRGTSTQKNPFYLSLSELFTYKTLISALAITGLLVAFIFFYKQYKAFNQPPTLEILSPKQNDVIKQESFVIEGFTGDPSIKIIVDGKEGNYIDALGKFRVNAKFATVGVNQFQIIAENQFGKKTQMQLDLLYQPDVQENSQKIRVKNISENTVNLTLFKDNLETPEILTINPNSTVEVEYTEKIRVQNFNKETLQLFLNNDAESYPDIDSSNFSITVRNNLPIIRIEQTNEQDQQEEE